jgi:hypothetical protein
MNESKRKSISSSWIIEFWANVFEKLSYFSIISFLKLYAPKDRINYGYIESYVTIHTFGALLSLVIVTIRRNEPITGLFTAITVYAAIRVFEITITQINILLFDEYRAKRAGQTYHVRSYRRTVLLLVHNYFELVCWFGLFYVYLYRTDDIVLQGLSADPTFFRVFRESLLMMVSFTPETNEPTSQIGILVLSVHSVVGLIMTLLVLARFLALLPKPETYDEFERDDTT